DTTWTIASFGDYDGDGKTDLFWRNTSTGYNSMWLMNGTATPLGVALPPVYDTGWMPVKP
ncbi:MAG: FG-GAP repeat domain-containing protein, partial [Thermoanaerobaculia bacterium]